MLQIKIPQFWPSQFSNQVLIQGASCYFDSAHVVNGMHDLADIRVSFPRLENHDQCLLVWQAVQERAQISLSVISTYVDNHLSTKYHLTIECSVPITYGSGMSNGLPHTPHIQ